MPVLKLGMATLLLPAVVACGAANGARAVNQSPASGLVLYNDTSHPVTLHGCAGCGSGQVVAEGTRQGFVLPSDSSRVQLDEAGGQKRCLTIFQGIASDKVTVVKVSDAGAC